MRPLVIVVATPPVETGLRCGKVQKAAALQEFGLHGAMHALDLAHGLRVAPFFRQHGAAPQGLEPRRISQTESLVSLVGPFCCPPFFQARGIAVVGDHPVRQSVHLENPRQPLANRGFARVGAGLGPDEMARMIVQHGQRQAALTLAVGPRVQREMTLEIHLPQEVGGFGLEPFERHGRRRFPLQQPTTPQDPGDRARRRYDRRGLDIALQNPPDLAPAPPPGAAPEPSIRRLPPSAVARLSVGASYPRAPRHRIRQTASTISRPSSD